MNKQEVEHRQFISVSKLLCFAWHFSLCFIVINLILLVTLGMVAGCVWIFKLLGWKGAIVLFFVFTSPLSAWIAKDLAREENLRERRD